MSCSPDAWAVEDTAAGGEGPHGPHIEIEGFSGPLDLLLSALRAEGVDLSALPLTELMDQLLTALHRAATLSERASWVVMGARILELRSRLLLPRDRAEQAEAEAEAETLRGRLVDLAKAQSLAAWLDARPQLGRDTFVCASQQPPVVMRGGAAQPDIIAFLWASIAIFEDVEADTETRYQPSSLDLHGIPEARERILRRLGDGEPGLSLPALLPPPEGDHVHWLRRRSAWTATFAAGLELAKQAAIVLEQPASEAPVVMRLPAGEGGDAVG
jgi:segregation and condensation protein A